MPQDAAEAWVPVDPDTAFAATLAAELGPVHGTST